MHLTNHTTKKTQCVAIPFIYVLFSLLYSPNIFFGGIFFTFLYCFSHWYWEKRRKRQEKKRQMWIGYLYMNIKFFSYVTRKLLNGYWMIFLLRNIQYIYIYIYIYVMDRNGESIKKLWIAWIRNRTTFFGIVN